MLLVYLLWIVVVLGGLFMGVGSIMTMVRTGFEASLALNALLYLGCAAYGLPRLAKLVFKRGS
jgi:hypothetical protein